MSDDEKLKKLEQNLKEFPFTVIVEYEPTGYEINVKDAFEEMETRRWTSIIVACKKADGSDVLKIESWGIQIMDEKKELKLIPWQRIFAVHLEANVIIQYTGP